MTRVPKAQLRRRSSIFDYVSEVTDGRPLDGASLESRQAPMGDHPGHVPLEILLDDDELETRANAVSNVSTTIQFVGFDMVDSSALTGASSSNWRKSAALGRSAEIRPHRKPVDRLKRTARSYRILHLRPPLLPGRYSTMIGPRITAPAEGAQ